MHYPRLPPSTILSPRPHARTRPHHLPIQLFRFLRLNEFDVLEGAGDGGDDKDGTYSPLSYRYEDPTQNISSIHMHKRSSCCQPRGKGQNVQLQRNATCSRKGVVCVCVPINRLAGRRRIYFCSNFHASYCLFIRSKISPILELTANDNPQRLMKNTGERGGGGQFIDEKMLRIRHRRRKIQASLV